MSARSPLTPLTNTPLTPRRPPHSKLVSPSTSRTVHAIASPTPHLSNFGEQDEGLQKKTLRRKSGLHEQLRKNLGSSSSSPTSSPRQNEVLNGLTSNQLASHYSDCIQLSTENKINAKNAFGLHLIDYMTELVKKKEMSNFQVASSTLDASVKIYAGRVDFIHTHTYKVLSGLGRKQNKGEEGSDEEDGGEDQDKSTIEDADAPKKKKKKTGKVRTIETNLKNITADKVDLGFEVDPMFQMMSAAFDEGGASGLLLNRLRCYDSSQSLILDSSTTVNVVEDVEAEVPQESKKPVDVATLKDLMDKMKLEDKHICPSLMDFKFKEWDKDMSIIQRKFSDFAFDPTAASAFPEASLPSVEEEADAIAHEQIDDLDNVEDDFENSLGGSSDNVIPGDMRTAEFVESAFSDLTHGSAGKLRQILAMQPSDYSYFNKVLMQTWAGPTHWKLTNKKAHNKTSDSDAKPKRTKKVPLVLDLNKKLEDLEKCLKLSKATSVTQATWAKYTKKKTTLPDDHMMDSKEGLFRLFHRPNLMIKLQRDESVSSVDDGVENYDYNNKNDVENFCPDQPRDDGDSYDDGGEFDISTENMVPGSHVSESSEASGLDGTVLTQDKLVAAPHKVQKLDIKYAKAAKRVDVRKLKTTMWNMLTKKEQTADLAPVPLPSSQEVEVALPHSFSQLTEELPAKVSVGMAKNLTIQTVFACLLYITNEKTLKLKASDAMDDLGIEQDST